MDARTRNRLREHSQPGHALIDCTDERKRSNVQRQIEGERFFRCSEKCGWFGWLDIDSLDSDVLVSG